MCRRIHRGGTDLEQHLDNLKTVGDLVRWGASRLKQAGMHFGHGTDNAADESRVLVFHALSLDFDIPEYFYQSRVTLTERDAVVSIIGRRIEEACPAAYLTGEAWFAGLRFEVTPDVLVPRSPIAELIVNGFTPWCQADGVSRALDIGTGSGCLAIAIAVHMGADVDAVDISPAAVSVAQRNVRLHELEQSVQIIHSDLYEALDENRKYDLIVSNPPYVSVRSMENLPREHTREPVVALTAGEDGLDTIHRILLRAADFLQADGVLVVEVGEGATALLDAYPGVPFEWAQFDNGGSGVFILERSTLEACRDLIANRSA